MDTIGNNKYTACFHSRLPEVKDKLGEITSFLLKSIPSITKENSNELKLIFSELLCNAVIHGNKLDERKSVSVYIEIENNNISSIVKDEGSGFDYTNLINSITKEDDALYCESGRGIWLVYALSDTLSFNIKGNEIKFIKKVR